jgi:hypothetical protein
MVRLLDYYKIQRLPDLPNWNCGVWKASTCALIVQARLVPPASLVFGAQALWDSIPESSEFNCQSLYTSRDQAWKEQMHGVEVVGGI